MSRSRLIASSRMSNRQTSSNRPIQSSQPIHRRVNNWLTSQAISQSFSQPINSSSSNNNNNYNNPLKPLRNNFVFSLVCFTPFQTNNPKLPQMASHIHDFVAILVNIGKRQLLQLSSIQFLSLTSPSLPNLLRERTRVLRLSTQHFHPCIVAQNVSIRRNRGFDDFLHRHHVDKPLFINDPTQHNRQTVLFF